MSGLARYLRVVWQIFIKDLQAEWHGKQGIAIMLVFALLTVFLFNFALGLTPKVQAALVSGVLWISLAFASTLGFNRSINLERENNAIDGLLLAPVDRSAIFFGKALSNFIFSFLVALVLLPVLSLFYQQNLLNLSLIGIVFLGLGAYASLGTFLSALSIQARTRDVLLPVMLNPLALPILIAAVEASRGVINALPFSEFQSWVAILFAGNILFIAAGLILFETLLEE